MAPERELPCAGARHPAPTAPDAERLEWLPCYPLPIRGVPVHTCSRCQPVSYSFGVIGGAYRIRRHEHRTGRVMETPPVPRAQAQAWWDALLAGWAV